MKWPAAKGVRRVAGQMNKLEAQYEAVLAAQKQAGAIAWYRYEAITLRLTDHDRLTRYTPDFLVMLANGELECHEVKGYLDVGGDAWLKLKLAADQYPMRFILCQHKNKETGWTSKVID